MNDRPVPDFETFVRSSLGRLLRTAVFLVGDLHTAEDLVQVALERTARHWRRVGDEHPEAYARKILVNLAIDRSKKRRRGHDVPAGGSADLELLAGYRVAAFGGPGADRPDDLSADLAALPPRQRAVLVLRYWCYLSEREIADALGISTGSVKSHASRAMSALHGRLMSAQEEGRR